LRESEHVGAIRTAVAALNAGDVDGYLRSFAPSCLRWVPGLEQPRTVSDIRDDIYQLLAAFEPLHLDEDLLFGDQRFVCARWRLRGVQTGDYMGIAPTRGNIAVQNCEVYEFDGERIVAVWTYGDPQELFRQIGAASEDREVP
jgi:predicted ester cyclase